MNNLSYYKNSIAGKASKMRHKSPADTDQTELIDDKVQKLFETQKRSVSKGKPEDFYPEVALSKSILNPVRKRGEKKDRPQRLSDSV